MRIIEHGSYQKKFFRIDWLGVSACLFSLAVVTGCTKIKLKNKALDWLGSHCFEIYILQRLPMIVLTSLGVNNNSYLFVAFTIPCVIIVAILFKSVLRKIDEIYFA